VPAWDSGGSFGSSAVAGFGGAAFPSATSPSAGINQASHGGASFGGVGPPAFANPFSGALGFSAPVEESGARPAADLRRVQDLEAQIRKLRDQVEYARRSARHAHSHPMQRELADLRERVGAQGDVNAQLQRELDQCRRDSHAVRVKTSGLQESIADREELLVDVRKRLRAEEEWISTLTEEITNHSTLHSFLTGHLSEADVKSDELKQELAYIHKAFDDAHVTWRPPRGNVGYGGQTGLEQGQRTGELSKRPVVQQSDELAFANRQGSPRGSPKRYIDDSPATRQAAEMLLPRSSRDAWERARLLVGSPGALVARVPPARRDFTFKTQDNFRNLLVHDRGPLYEDPKLLMLVAISVDRASRIPRFDIEIAVQNRGGVPFQQVQLVSNDPGYIHACKLDLQPVPSGGDPGMLWPRDQLRWRAQLKVLAPFETGPQVELSYLLPDSMRCHSRLRLPLSVTRLLTPVQLDPRRFLELWHSNQFEEAEAAFVVQLRPALLDQRSGVSCATVVQLGGVLQVLHGLGESHNNIALATSYPHRKVTSPEILVHVELGGPDGHGGPLCRVAVRAESNPAARAIAQTLLDVLGDCPDPENNRAIGT